MRGYGQGARELPARPQSSFRRYQSPKTPPVPGGGRKLQLASTQLVHRRTTSEGALLSSTQLNRSFDSYHTRLQRLEEREKRIASWQKTLEAEASSNHKLQDALAQREETIAEIEKIRERKMGELKDWARQKADGYNDREQRLNVRARRLQEAHTKLEGDRKKLQGKYDSLYGGVLRDKRDVELRGTRMDRAEEDIVHAAHEIETQANATAKREEAYRTRRRRLKEDEARVRERELAATTREKDLAEQLMRLKEREEALGMKLKRTREAERDVAEREKRFFSTNSLTVDEAKTRREALDKRETELASRDEQMARAIADMQSSVECDKEEIRQARIALEKREGSLNVLEQNLNEATEKLRKREQRMGGVLSSFGIGVPSPSTSASAATPGEGLSRASTTSPRVPRIRDAGLLQSSEPRLRRSHSSPTGSSSGASDYMARLRLPTSKSVSATGASPRLTQVHASPNPAPKKKRKRPRFEDTSVRL